jgi:hypothetical protein
MKLVSSKTLVATAVGAALLATLPGISSANVLGVDYSPSAVGATGENADIWTLGYAFSANSAASVVALGALDLGITGDETVGLWSSGGTLLAEATVNGSETPVGSAPWVFTNINPVALTAGQTYYVGAYGVADYQFQVNPITVASQITFLHNAWSLGYGFPGSQSGSSSEHAFFGGNVELGAVSAPEPATLALFGAGLAGLGMIRRRRRGTKA